MDNINRTFVVQFNQSDNTYSKLKFKEISDDNVLQVFMNEQTVYKPVFNIDK
jgi:hypothetical protein